MDLFFLVAIFMGAFVGAILWSLGMAAGVGILPVVAVAAGVTAYGYLHVDGTPSTGR